MKKILLATVFTMTALTAVADDAAVATNGDALTGVLLGVEGALQRTDYTQKLNTVDLPHSALAKVKNPSYDLTGSLSLGYFKNQDGMYYGVKLSGGKNLGARTKKAVDGSAVPPTYTGIKLKIAQQYNLALTGQLGGYVGQNTVVYGLFGVKRVRYDFNIQALNTGTGNSMNKNVGKVLWGPVLGFGLKQALSDSWAFNTEVSYERYKKVSTGNADNAAALALNQQIGMSIKPQVWNLIVGISHKF